MRRPFFVGIFVLSLVAMPALQRAYAAPPMVQQCLAPDGRTLYTDKPCRSVGAQSVAMRGELATRLVREQVTEARYTGVEVSYIVPDSGTRREARQAISRRSAQGGCARTPTQLAMDLRGAFALGDVNRIAESFHWVGMSPRAANATMQRLQRLSQRNVVDAQYFGMGGWNAMADAGGAGDGAPSGGVLQVRFGDGASTSLQDFDVQRYAGCYFARF